MNRWVVTAVLSCLIAYPCGAFALTIDTTTPHGTTSGSDRVLVGCRDFGLGWMAVVCVNDRYFFINANGCSLDQNVYIYGDDGADNMYDVSVSTPSPLLCVAGGIAADWKQLFHGSYVVELYGQDDDDNLTCGKASCRLYGGNDDDYLLNHSDYRTDGQAGNDEVVCDANLSTVDLFGGSGDDCLWSAGSNTQTSTFDCGSDSTDDYYVNSITDEVNCELTTSQCGFSFQ